MQPRYLLPLLVMLAGISLLPAADEQLRFTRGQVVVLVTAMSAAQSIALYYNVWRYTKGLQRPFEFLGGDGWWWTWPFPSPTAVWLLGSVSFAVLAGLLLGRLGALANPR
jgi:hypothetical protein